MAELSICRDVHFQLSMAQRGKTEEDLLEEQRARVDAERLERSHQDAPVHLVQKFYKRSGLPQLTVNELVDAINESRKAFEPVCRPNGLVNILGGGIPRKFHRKSYAPVTAHQVREAIDVLRHHGILHVRTDVVTLLQPYEIQANYILPSATLASCFTSSEDTSANIELSGEPSF